VYSAESPYQNLYVTREGSVLTLRAGSLRARSSALDLVFVDMGKRHGVDRGALLSISKETVLDQGAASFRDFQGLALVLQSLETSAMGLVIDTRGPIERNFIVSGAPTE
ncbi:MAG: hypothetical protein RRA35_09090, partial [Desulfomonilia bacterium]|nr:hypothetical protein [Desulfomonilia bacterium]